MKRHSNLLFPFLLLGLFALVSPVRAGTVNTSINTFVLSNEGTNGFITQLLAANYGNENLYQALEDILTNTNPSASSVLTPAFLQALSACPPSSAIFTTQLKNVNAGIQGVAISDDGTVQLVSIFGSTYQGQAGTATLVVNASGVGSADFVHSATSGGTLTSFVVSSGGITTTYNVFAIGFTPATYQTFVLSNEGANGLITQLLAAGYGNFNLYQALEQIQQNCNPTVAGILTSAFFQALAADPASSAIFTTQLKNVNPGAQGLAISTDGTAQLVSIFGATYKGASGTTTLVSNISGVGNGTFISSSTSGGTLTSFSPSGITYNVFGIGYSPGTTTTPTVPAASIWGLIVLAALLTGIAALRLTRRTEGGL